ncbi:MAG: hypothetical protein RIQ43_465 [Pseudomonadota bacterium]|jgi:hexosaminidase
MKRIGLVSLGLMLVSMQAAAFTTQTELDEFARSAELKLGVVSNFNANGSFKGQLVLRNRSRLALAPGTGRWQLYLHSIRKLVDAEIAGLKLSHVQGDLHSLTPTGEFKGLPAGGTLQMPFHGANWVVSYTDFMPRAFLVSPGLKPAVLAGTDTEDLRQFVLPFETAEQQLRQTDDRYPIASAQSRFDRNRAANAVQLDHDAIIRRIFPTPKHVTYPGGSVIVDDSWHLEDVNDLTGNVRYLWRGLQQQAGMTLPIRQNSPSSTHKSIRLEVDAALVHAESYHLEISGRGIIIRGRDATGVFYGIQSLLSLIPAKVDPDALRLPLLSAQDVPRYGWRGMHYDMARNFHGKPVTLRLIDQMSRVKLNKLHLHLSDDEGWRLQIPGLPELTELGATRCFDLEEQRCLLTQLGTGPDENGSGNGYYSRADFIEILKYAAERHIEVIPEIDMPGHGRAAIKAMQSRYQRLMKAGDATGAQQYLLSDPADTSTYLSVQNYTDNSVNVCQQSTYDFIAKVVTEIQSMYREVGLHLNVFHIGGDEVAKGSWLGSPSCQALIKQAGSGLKDAADLKPYFVRRTAVLLHAMDVSPAGWEDGLMHDATTPFPRDELPSKQVIANVWDNIWEWGVADRAYRLANSGYQVVLSHATHLYFDHPHEAASDERGYYWASRYTDLEKVFGYMPDDVYANADRTRMGETITDLEKTVGRALPPLEKPENILGMQGHVWSETIRTDEQLERMIYPRMQMMAERAWHKASWEGSRPNLPARDAQWAETAYLLAVRELPKLHAQAVHVYLPKPGVSMQQGRITANTALPGMSIFYSRDTQDWNRYTEPLPLRDGRFCFRSQLDGEAVSHMQCVTGEK